MGRKNDDRDLPEAGNLLKLLQKVLPSHDRKLQAEEDELRHRNPFQHFQTLSTMGSGENLELGVFEGLSEGRSNVVLVFDDQDRGGGQHTGTEWVFRFLQKYQGRIGWMQSIILDVD